jgi:hypothetical protein
VLCEEFVRPANQGRRVGVIYALIDTNTLTHTTACGDGAKIDERDCLARYHGDIDGFCEWQGNSGNSREAIRGVDNGDILAIALTNIAARKGQIDGFASEEVCPAFV